MKDLGKIGSFQTLLLTVCCISYIYILVYIFVSRHTLLKFRWLLSRHTLLKFRWLLSRS